jgi:hypothetical protein
VQQQTTCKFSSDGLADHVNAISGALANSVVVGLAIS